jgi:hypothetical protein
MTDSGYVPATAYAPTDTPSRVIDRMRDGAAVIYVEGIYESSSTPTRVAALGQRARRAMRSLYMALVTAVLWRHPRRLYGLRLAPHPARLTGDRLLGSFG